MSHEYNQLSISSVDVTDIIYIYEPSMNAAAVSHHCLILLFINPVIQVSERCHRSFQTEPLSVDLDVTSDSDGVQPGANQVHIDHASERPSCHTKSRLAGVLAPWTLLFQY